jgi:hypothetical protein
MNRDEIIPMLQLSYAAMLADATYQFGKEGVLESVIERKRKEQLEMGAQKATRFGIQSAEEVFTQLSVFFRSATWQIRPKEEGFCAKNRVCILANIARQLKAPSPCRLYCLDPMEGMVRGLEPGASFNVEETLWEGNECRVDVFLLRSKERLK